MNICIDTVDKIQNKRPKAAPDFRKALEDKSLDAMVIATPDHWHAPEGGVLGLIVNWFGALLGPTSMPKAAIASIIAGVLTFIITKRIATHSLAIDVGLPTVVSAVVFIAVGLATKAVPAKVKDLLAALKKTT